MRYSSTIDDGRTTPHTNHPPGMAMAKSPPGLDGENALDSLECELYLLFNTCTYIDWAVCDEPDLYEEWDDWTYGEPKGKRRELHLGYE